MTGSLSSARSTPWVRHWPGLAYTKYLCRLDCGDFVPTLELLVKERLTGAIILVVLIVLLVPELLSGPKHPVTQAPAAAASSGEEVPLRSYTINLADDTHPHGTPGATNGPAMPQPSGPDQPSAAAQSGAAPAADGTSSGEGQSASGSQGADTAANGNEAAAANGAIAGGAASQTLPT